MGDAPKPGVYPDVTFDEYYGWDAMNATLLKLVNKQSPIHAWTERLVPQSTTPAKQLGDAIHACVLEPERFEGQYAKGLEHNKVGKKKQEAWAAHQEEHAGKTLLSVKDYNACLEMRAGALNGHRDTAELLRNPGAVEVSLVWIDKRTGLVCKARIDKMTTYGPYPVLADLKSCPDASPQAFARDCAKFQYELQAAHYLEGAHTLSPRERDFLFIAQEKKAPFASMVHQLGPDSLRSGELARRRAMRTWAYCVQKNEFPGYEPGVSTIDLPRYAIDLDESLTEGDEE